ncbi:MAG TPA: DUF6544 family protein [Ramlibacter sp.]|nr:DUF6544 family protein [Ramlibacter sp.]
MKVLVVVAAVLVIAAVLLGLRRWADERDASRAWTQLAASSSSAGQRFEAALVAQLPDPARRYFLFSIAPGTPLRPVSEITMEGELSLGTRADPRTQPMQARQILASPHGFVWRLRAGQGAMSIAGSDAMVADRSWTRFWLLGLGPVARAGGDADHLRSSLGRTVAEAVAWSPASLLPQADVAWTAEGPDTARVTVTHRGMTQSVDIRVDAEGRPLWVRMMRWSNANPQAVYQLQPFGGELGDFRVVDGYRLAHRLDGGNFFGTADYFPFYRARVLAITLR